MADFYPLIGRVSIQIRDVLTEAANAPKQARRVGEVAVPDGRIHSSASLGPAWPVTAFPKAPSSVPPQPSSVSAQLYEDAIRLSNEPASPYGTLEIVLMTGQRPVSAWC